MGKIKNLEELSTSSLRKAVLEVAEAGLEAIDTKKFMDKLVQLEEGQLSVAGEKVDLKNVGKVILVSIGKCASGAAEALESKLGDMVSGGVVLYVGAEGNFKKLKSFKGTHPLPSEENELGAKAIIESLNGLNENDLVIFVISGGGSTLLCSPQKMMCQDESKVLTILSRAGATIKEINTVRKHLSLARGGFLARYAYPAKVISLIFSDVIGNDIQFISSGPTVKDATIVEEAREILKRYDAFNASGISEDNLVETPKEDKYFEKVTNQVVLSNKIALDAMAEKARELGFKAEIKDAGFFGEAKDKGLEMLREIKKAEPKTIFLYGGETTVTVKGSGRGGRNLELATSALKEVKEGEILVSIASDGMDNGGYAGAICDTITKEAAENIGMNAEFFLENNNEYEFFEKVGNYILTGDTGSNVSDLAIAAKS